MKKLVVLFFSLILAGCATHKSLYYWGDYAGTAYDYKKTPSEATRLAHYEELNNIVVKSGEQNKKVPPGIYIELAMIASEMGNANQAMVFLNNEVELYPESENFVSVIRSKLVDGA